MMKRSTLCAGFRLWYACVLSFAGFSLYAQNPGDYRTKSMGSGLWSNASSWERYDGSNWQDAASAPGSSDGVITVRNGFIVTISTAITIDQTTIETGGKVIHSGAVTVTLADGVGTDMTINGTWTRTANLNTINRNTGATIAVGATGIYEQAITASGGSIPIASWDNNSILRLMNNHSGNTSYSNLNQTFGIVEYNRPNQTTDHNDLTPGDVTNELRIISTGSGSIRLQGVAITGSFLQSGGKCKITSSSGNVSASIGGNFTLGNGSFWMSDASGSSSTVELNINGNCTISGGDFQFGTTSSTSAASFLKCKGNVTLSGGAITGFLPDASGFYFNGTSIQTLDIGISLGVNTRNSFWYLTVNGPTGLNETYSGTVAQQTVTGTRTNPGGNWAAFPTAGTMLNTLTVNNNAGLSLARNVLVNTALVFQNGVLTPGTFSLSLNTAANASGYGPGKYIEGACSKVGTAPFLFPIGKSSRFSPVEISNISSSSTFTAEYFGSAPANSGNLEVGLHHISNLEYWMLNRTAGSGSATVTLHWENTRSGDISELNDLRVARYNESQWVNELNTGTSGNPSAGSVSSGMVSNFSPFTLGSSSSSNLMGTVLPIELLQFNATLQSDAVLLEWSTAAEQNSDFFTIERSQNGRDWEKIGTLPAAGFSNSLIQYHMTDARPQKGINYYRLKQTDLNGSTEIFQVIPLQYQPKSDYTIKAYPVPLQNILTVSAPFIDTPLTYYLLNVQGQIMHSGLLENSLEQIDVSQLPSGTYWFRLGNEANNNFQLIKH